MTALTPEQITVMIADAEEAAQYARENWIWDNRPQPERLNILSSHIHLLVTEVEHLRADNTYMKTTLEIIGGEIDQIGPPSHRQLCDAALHEVEQLRTEEKDLREMLNATLEHRDSDIKISVEIETEKLRAERDEAKKHAANIIDALGANSPYGACVTLARILDERDAYYSVLHKIFTAPRDQLDEAPTWAADVLNDY